MKIVVIAGVSLALFGIAAPDVVAQSRVPEMRLTNRPLMEIGRSSIELHRVAGAAIAASGALVIADAGNHRVLVISPQGRLVREFGRRGSGPREFQDISQLWVAGDTIITYDAQLSRVTIWRPDGTLIETVTVPSYQDRPVFLYSALSAWRYVGRIARDPTGASRAGLHRDSATVVLVDGRSGALRQIGKFDWAYTYLYVQQNATAGPVAMTGYRTPFLGETHLTTVAGHIAVVPRTTATVELRDPDGTLRSTVSAPIDRRPLTRHIVNAYRDSMVAAARPSAARFPGNIDRLNDAFGPRLQLPAGEFSPILDRVSAAGRQLWLQALAPDRSSDTSWYVVDIDRNQVTGHVIMPADWLVLGGGDRSVIILRRDEFDVQYIQVYGIGG